jgi:hypothetical protein
MPSGAIRIFLQERDDMPGESDGFILDATIGSCPDWRNRNKPGGCIPASVDQPPFHHGMSADQRKIPT